MGNSSAYAGSLGMTFCTWRNQRIIDLVEMFGDEFAERCLRRCLCKIVRPFENSITSILGNAASDPTLWRVEAHWMAAAGIEYAVMSRDRAATSASSFDEGVLLV